MIFRGRWLTPQRRLSGKKGSSAPTLLTKTICFTLALFPNSTRFAVPCNKRADEDADERNSQQGSAQLRLQQANTLA